MAKTPKKQAKESPAKTEAPKAEAKPAVETAAVDTASSKDAAAPSSDTAATTDAAATPDAAPKASGGGRPISHFSSVSTPEYRSGWESIFGSKSDDDEDEKPRRTKKSREPVDLEIAFEDLDADIQAALAAVAAKMAKQKRLNYGKLERQDLVSWEITCRIAGG